MGAFDDHILVVWDIINAFNELERAALMEHCRASPKYHDLFRYLESELRPRSHIYSLVNGRLQLVPYRSAQGGQQGAYSAGAGIKVGNVGDDDEFVDAAASITLTALGTYGVALRSGARVSAQQVQASISGSPSQGAGKVYVTYSIPATA